MKNEILEILQEMKPGVTIDENTHLIDDSVLDSLEVMNLSVELNDEYDIFISPLDIVPENFNSVEAIANMVERLMNS